MSGTGRENAAKLVAGGRVVVDSCSVEETTKTRKLKTPDGPVTRQVTYRDWRVIGKAGDVGPVEITVNDTGQIIFGRCRCPFFDEHLLNQGPCEHMLALFQVSEPLRVDGASSQAAEQPRGKTTRREPSRWEVDSAAQSGDVTDDLSGSEEDA